jgi:hypothetical protein
VGDDDAWGNAGAPPGCLVALEDHLRAIRESAGKIDTNISELLGLVKNDQGFGLPQPLQKSPFTSAKDVASSIAENSVDIVRDPLGTLSKMGMSAALTISREQDVFYRATEGVRYWLAEIEKINQVYPTATEQRKPGLENFLRNLIDLTITDLRTEMNASMVLPKRGGGSEKKPLIERQYGAAWLIDPLLAATKKSDEVTTKTLGRPPAADPYNVAAAIESELGLRRGFQHEKVDVDVTIRHEKDPNFTISGKVSATSGVNPELGFSDMMIP